MNASDAAIPVFRDCATAVLKFFVPGRVTPKGSLAIGKTKQGNLFLRSSTKGRDAKAWQHTVSTGALFAMRQRNQLLLEGALFGVFTFVRPRPKQHFGAHGVKDSFKKTLPETRPDADKLCRAIGDALTNVVYRDDSQLTTVILRKRWATIEGVHVAIWYDHSDGDIDVPDDASRG